MIPNLYRVWPTIHPSSGRKGLDFTFFTPDTEYQTTHIHIVTKRGIGDR